MILKQIFYGLIAIAIGVITLKYNFQIVNNTARLEFFETRVGAGSTFLVYKLLSLALVLGGILYMTGFGDEALGFLLKPIISLFPKV